MEYNKKKTKTEVPKTDDGMVGIRATLNNMGISNESIGFDDKSNTVTLNGKAFMTPSYLDDNAGVSYATEKDIQKSLVDFYSGSSDPVVRVSDAYSSMAGKYGLTADALTYGNGTVSVGGVPLDVMYIDDSGKAWTYQSRVADAVESYADTVGAVSPENLVAEYERRYLSDASDLADSLKNREEFSYDPDDDPVFQAYKNKYQLEGERAGRDYMASYSALTGGMMNSAAATAGAQAQQYYSAQIANAIPELAEQAYQRYVDKYQTDMNLLGEIVSMYDTAYNNAADANALQIANANSSAKSNTNRDAASYEQNWDNLIKEQAYRLKEQEYAQNDLDSYWDELFNAQQLMENQYTNEGLVLDNTQKQAYLKYYEKLLDAEYQGMLADTELSKAQAYKAYYK